MNRLAAVLALAATAACTHVSFRETNLPPHALEARPPGSVEVFALGPPQRPFVEVGLIDAGNGGWVKKDLLAALREAAGERGCDGLVLTGEREELVDVQGTLTLDQRSKGVCIVWRDEAEPPVAANGAR